MMSKQDENPKKPYERLAGAEHKTMLPGNILSTYTALAVLRKMKVEVGIEAMHEYMDRYVADVEDANPKLKQAVTKVLSVMNIRRMYQRGVCRER